MEIDSMKKWLKVTLVVESVLVESLADFLVGVIDAGVEFGVDDEVNMRTMNVYVEQENLNEAEMQAIVAQVSQHGRELAGIFKVSEPQLSWEVIEEEDWGTNWKKHFSPFAITTNLVIAPTWEDYSAKGNEKVLIMDPGMAFGTGHHATTSLVVQFLEEEILGSRSCRTVLDVGTGTGILGMAAAMLGADQVYGIDNDPVAVEVARGNCQLNDLSEIMEVDEQPLAEVTASYSMVVANIIHDVLIEMAPEMRRVTEIGGKLVLSGILDGSQAESAISMYEKHGFTLENRRSMKEWAALLFTRVS
jgi:ribosomal protein L11 methyltransferase